MNDGIIQVENLNHHFGTGETRTHVLQGIDLTVLPGEIVILTGMSGCGKTTLLTLLGGLRRVQEGKVQVLGYPLHELDDQQLVAVRRNIGFIFQAHNLFASLTALQNVRMSQQLHEEDEVTKRALEVLTDLGLAERIHHKPNKLSGGQRQRVAIARALVNRPRLILADEPTAALDKEKSMDVVNLLQELAEKDRSTIIIVTHDDRILDKADRIINMFDGKIDRNTLVKESLKICMFLERCDAFKGQTPDALANLAEKMKIERFLPGAVIIRQGDMGDKFYLVRNGQADVFLEGPDGVSAHKATIEEGGFFGERSLLLGEPRNATVVAQTPLELYCLDKEHFLEAIRQSGTLKEQVLKVYFSRR